MIQKILIVKSSLIFALLIILTSTNSGFAQTDEEIAYASKCLGRPQNKTSALAFFAGYYEQKQQYDKAIDYNLKMLALFEKDLGKNSPKTLWALSKIGKCYALDNKNLLADLYFKRCWESLHQTALGDPRFLQFEQDALEACAWYFEKSHQIANLAAVNLEIKRLSGSEH